MNHHILSSGNRARATLALALALFICLPQLLRATTRTWNGSANGFWTTAANWSPGNAPQDGDDLVFPAGAARLVTTNNTSSTRRYSSITLSGANYFLRGNSLTVSNGISGEQAAGTNTIEFPITLGAAQTFECLYSSGALTFAGGITNAGFTLTVIGAGDTTLSGQISGAGGLTKGGSGTLLLAGSVNNTYTGLTTVGTGTLKLNDTAAATEMVPGDLVINNGGTLLLAEGNQIANTSAVTINSGGLLDLNGYNETIGSSLTLNNGDIQTGAGTLTLGANSTVTLTSFPSISGNLNVGSGTCTFQGGGTLYLYANVAGSADIVKNENSSLRLYGANSFTGTLTANNTGYIAVASDQALGATNGGTILNNVTYLAITGNISITNETLTMFSGNTNAIHVWSSSTNVWRGPVTLITQTTVEVLTNCALELDGPISGIGGITKYGPGRLRYSGAAQNSYSGTTAVTEGLLELNKSGGVNAMAGDLLVGENIGAAECVRWLNGAQLPSSTDVTVNDGALLDLNDFSEALGALTLTGGEVQTGTGLLTLGGNVTAGSTTNRNARVYGRLSLGSATRTFNVTSGPIAPHLRVFAEVSGTGGILKTGPATVSLDSSNTYSGLTTVAEGTLLFVYAGTPGNTNAGTIVEDGAAIQMFDAHVGEEALTLQGAGASGYGALKADWSNNRTSSWSGPITLVADTTVSVDHTNLLNLSGPISGPGGILKRGAAILVLSGSSANTFTGDVYVNSGTLLLDKSVTDGAIPGPGALIIGDGTGGEEADVVRELRNYQIDSTVNITVNESGLLDLNNYSDAVGGLNLTYGHVATGTGTLTLGGNVVASRTATGIMENRITGRLSLGTVTRTFELQDTTNGAARLFLLADVSGTGGLTKTGPGRLFLEGDNTFSGLTTVSEGVLEVFSSTALGTVAAGTVVAAGSALGVDHVDVNEPLTLNGTLYKWDGGGDSIAWTGPITLASDASVDVQGGTLDLAAVVSGPGGFTKTGDGTLTLSGASGNTYGGTATVLGGVLQLNKSAGNAIPGPLVIGDGLGGSHTDIVRLMSANEISDGVAVTVNKSGLLDLNNFGDELAAGASPLTLNGGGDVQTGSGTLSLGVGGVVVNPVAGGNYSSISGKVNLLSAGTRVFTVNPGAAADDLFLLATVSGSAPIVKNGAGAMQLSASNTFSGSVTINEGLVRVSNDAGLGATNGATIINSNAALWICCGVEVAGEAVTNTSSSLSAIASTSGTNGWSGPVVLNTTTHIDVWTNGMLTLSGVVSGPAGFAKEGEGTLRLSGTAANTYAGTTWVNAGTLSLAKTGGDDKAIPGSLVVGDGVGDVNADVVRRENVGFAQINDDAPVTVNSSGLLAFDGATEIIGSLAGSGNVDFSGFNLTAGHNGQSTVFSGVLSGVGGRFAKAGSGTMTLTGNNTYDGTTTVSGGTLLVNGSQLLSAIAIQASATLGGTGTVGVITSTGGVVSPGLSPGTLTSSNVVLDAASSFIVELIRAGDRLNVRGQVGLGNASLVLSAPHLLPAEGQELLILSNDDTDAITGTFAGLPEGALVTAGPRQFRITYAGDTGNDVVLIATNTAALRPTLSVWPTATNTVVVAWPQSDLAWHLHATTNLLAPLPFWTELPPPYVTNGANLEFTEPAPAGNKFYRLHTPWN